MDVIKTGLGLTKTIRNVQRLKEILVVFAKHGFREFIGEGIMAVIPDLVLPEGKILIKKDVRERSKAEWQQLLGQRLRICFEELGPTFVKLGQLLSSREDIFDPLFIDELKILRDHARVLPFSEIELIMKQTYGDNWREIFIELDPNPIGTASIGVVHRGVLKGGKEVVIKFKRPGIDKIIDTDFSIIQFLVFQLEKTSEEIRYLSLGRIINDFSIGLQNELNFYFEKINCRKLKENISKHDKNNLIYIPEVYDEWSRDHVLVMEMIKGIPFSSPRIEKHIKSFENSLIECVKIFMKTFLADGFFHADLHGGNFFYIEETKKIGLIDFGLMGVLGKKSRLNFISIIYSLVKFDFERVVIEFLDVADYNNIPDVQVLIQDVREALSPFIGLSLQQTRASQILKTIIATLTKHQIYLPRDWVVVLRALVTLDGVGKSLKIDFDLILLIEEDLHEIFKQSFNKETLIEEIAWTSKDFLSVGRMLPQHLKWFLREWAKNKYTFEVRNDDLVKSIERFHPLGQGFILLMFSGIFWQLSYHLVFKQPTLLSGQYVVPGFIWPILAIILSLIGLKKVFKG